MTAPWNFSGSPPRGSNDTETLIEGSTFCICDSSGDIIRDRQHGLFVRDTRVLSQWLLTVNGRPVEHLSTAREDPFRARFIGRGQTDNGVEGSLLIVRDRSIGNGMREDVTVRNLASFATECTLTIALDSDFADLFEVKEGRAVPRDDVRRLAFDRTVRLGAVRSGITLESIVRSDGDPTVGADTLTWSFAIAARSSWSASIEVVPAANGVELTLRHPRGHPVEQAVPATLMREWRDRAPRLRTADRVLTAALRRSIDDLGSLRIYDPGHPERAVVAAGAPWFMALFGRDALLTSWMLLALDPSLAGGTLRTLADHQGHGHDPVTEEEPGRILHELRFGPSTAFALGGRSVYYGTADATPLFVMLFGELLRWRRDPEDIAALLPHVDRALAWIEGDGDLDGDGFVEYARRGPSGLANQGWKDSWDGINFSDGRIAEAPIALAEVQAYCYGAFVARARVAVGLADEEGAARWSAKAADLKQRFNDAFWLDDQGWFAVGLDRDKKPIDALTSNIGHCLWTGIVDDAKAPSIATHLLSSDMFSGWGIRTLAASMTAYNPMSYHNGSIWPHDNALCAAGLMRYGFVAEAQRVATAILDAAHHFDHRLPELFCGFGRDEFIGPVPYPAACSPQAWASAAPVQLLTTLLGIEPDASTSKFTCSPEIPERFLPLMVEGIAFGGTSVSVDVLLDRFEVRRT